MKISFVTSRTVYAIGGIIAAVGFFFPWMTYHHVGMPNDTVAITTWSGWNITLPVGFPALVVGVVAVIVSLANEPLHALWIRIMTLFGLLSLIGATILLLPDDQVVLFPDLPPQIDYGLILTYSGYAGMIIGSFVLARRARETLSLSVRER